MKTSRFREHYSKMIIGYYQIKNKLYLASNNNLCLKKIKL